MLVVVFPFKASKIKLSVSLFGGRIGDLKLHLFFLFTPEMCKVVANHICGRGMLLLSLG